MCFDLALRSGVVDLLCLWVVVFVYCCDGFAVCLPFVAEFLIVLVCRGVAYRYVVYCCGFVLVLFKWSDV